MCFFDRDFTNTACLFLKHENRFAAVVSSMEKKKYKEQSGSFPSSTCLRAIIFTLFNVAKIILRKKS